MPNAAGRREIIPAVPDERPTLPLRISFAFRAFLIAALAVACCAPSALAREVYVGSLGDSIAVFDSVSGALGTPVNIGTGSEPYTIAIAPNGKTLYSANYENDTVSVVDTATKTVTATIPVGNRPLGIAVSPNGTRVYVANSADANVTVIDTATNQPIGGTIATGNEPLGIAVSPDGTHALVSNSSDASVSLLDLGTGELVSTADVGERPYGIAFTPDGSHAYVANNNSDSVSVLDGHSGQVVGGPIPVGEDPSGVAVGPNGLRAYVANYSSGTMSVIDTQTNTVLSTVSGPQEVEYVAITPDGTTGFLSSYGVNSVLPFGTAPDPSAFGPPIATSTEPSQIAVVPNQGPIAKFTYKRIRPGVPGTLDASGSTDSDGTIASYAWNFTDGGTAVTAAPTVSHKFAKPGSYTVQLTVTDNEGCSTNLTFTGQTASCNGGAPAMQALPVEVAYPGIKLRCPKKAGGRCTIALFAVKVGHKRGKATVKIQSKPVRTRLKPGASRIVSIKPKARFAKKLAKAKKITVLQATKVGGEVSVRLRKLRVVR